MKEIPLTQGRSALVDDEDYQYLIQFNWHASRYGNIYYAKRIGWVNGKRTSIRMHREIMGLIESKNLCDHIDGNGLNNQKVNLRIANYFQNNRNRRPQSNTTSRYKGVSRHRLGWQCRITHANKNTKHIGYFKTEEEAAIAYNKEAQNLFGGFAWLNKVSK